MVINYNEDAWKANKTKAVDENDILLSENDTATAILGKDWRMPTQKDFKELVEKTTNEWTTLNGINGRLFTSKTNGNSIFIPAAGYRWCDSINERGSEGYVWSSSFDNTDLANAIGIYFENGRKVYIYTYPRRYGFSVRPIYKG